MNRSGVKAIKISQRQIRETNSLIRAVSDGDTIKILPSSFYKSIDRDILRLFMHHKAYYAVPTVELIQFLRDEINGASAIEIGCGHGELARELGIPATDSRMQEKPEIQLTYKLSGQPLIKYPPFVAKFEATEAVKHYKPDVVFGCYITKRFDGTDGNVEGVHEPEILPLVKKFIHVGDKITHGDKPLMKMKFKEINPDWLIIRGRQPFIGIWENE